MNNPDHISESLETIFWVKILRFFDADLGWNKIRIRYPGWKKFGSGINIPVNTAFVFDYRTPYRDLFIFTVRTHILGTVIAVWTWVKPFLACQSRVLPKSHKAFVWFFGVPFFVVVSK